MTEPTPTEISEASGNSESLEVTAESLIEEVSIDGMCGVY